MLYMLDKEKSTSPHTICEAYQWKINKWVVVDVGNNLIFKKKNGDLMSRADMANNWNLCLSILTPVVADAKYWDFFLNDCYLVKVREP